MTSNVLENLSKLVRKSSQNTSKIDLEGGLESAREPPLSGGDPKTILGDFGSTLTPHLGTSFGSCWASFFDVFLTCLLDGIFGDLGSIWALFLRPFGVRFWKLV